MLILKVILEKNKSSNQSCDSNYSEKSYSMWKKALGKYILLELSNEMGSWILAQ